MVNSLWQTDPSASQRRRLVLVYQVSPAECRPWIELALRCGADAQRVATLAECESLASSTTPTVIVADAPSVPTRFVDRGDRAFGAVSLLLISDLPVSDPVLGLIDCVVVSRHGDSVADHAALDSALTEADRRYDERERVRDYHRRCDSLSPDERGVFDSVCVGRLNKQIANDMQVSVRTIEQRRRRVFQKMGVDSAVPLATMRAMVETLESQWNRLRHTQPTPRETADVPAPHIAPSAHDTARIRSEAPGVQAPGWLG